MLEILAAAFEYGLAGIALVLAIIAVWLVRDALSSQKEIVSWIQAREEADTKAEEQREQRAAKEREVMITLMDTVFSRAHERYADLTSTLKDSMDEILRSNKDALQEILNAVKDFYTQTEKNMTQIGNQRNETLLQIEQAIGSMRDASETQNAGVLDALKATEQALMARITNLETLVNQLKVSIETKTEESHERLSERVGEPDSKCSGNGRADPDPGRERDRAGADRGLRDLAREKRTEGNPVGQTDVQPAPGDHPINPVGGD